ncbi:MAG: laccase domain-containing protein [Parasporobacterium sp.]|nr:laccase domain-containing protein [Parasporobacterium sp.]
MKWIDRPELQIPYYCFENLLETDLVINAFTTKLHRKNGRMDDFCQLLLRSDSDPEEVRRCTDALLLQFGIDREHLVPSAQKHTANLHIVTGADLGPLSSRPKLESVDGLITDIPGVMLQTFGADCPSVYLLDPMKKVIGLCHSGRKGTQQHIASLMLKQMEESFGTDPGTVLAAISPGICVSCYEVGEDVAMDFADDYLTGPVSGQTKNEELLRSILIKKAGRYYIDLPCAISISLIHSGIRKDHLEVSPLCTRCRSDRFFSFRAEGRISNENCAFLMLKA